MICRRNWIVLAIVASLGIIAVWFVLPRNPYGKVWEKYREVHEGLSENEVRELFGVPPGQYNTAFVSICSSGQEDEFAAVNACHSKKLWLFDEGVFEIGFDKEKRVQKKAASANMGGKPSMLARLMYSLGL